VNTPQQPLELGFETKQPFADTGAVPGDFMVATYRLKPYEIDDFLKTMTMEQLEALAP
jgi:hypothetical protein